MHLRWSIVASCLITSCLAYEPSALAEPGAAAGTTTPAPSATATTIGAPDPSTFDIPVLVMDKHGFGKDLEEACAGTTPYKPEKAASDAVAGWKGQQAPQPNMAAAPAAARVLVTGQAIAGAVKEASAPGAPAADAARPRVAADPLDVVAATVKVICEDIQKSSVTDVELDQLREFEKSGVLPRLTQGLAAGSTLAELKKALGTPAGAPQAPTLPSTSTLSGFESNLINGLADFLVTRSKEEAILYLQDKLSKDLCEKDKVSDLLPNTCSTLKGLDASLSIAAMGTALNAAAREDLVGLPDALLKLAETKDPARFYGPEALRLVYAMMLDMKGGRAPKEVAQSMYAMPARLCEKTATGDAPTQICAEVFQRFRFTSALLYATESNSFDQIIGSDPTFSQHLPRVVGTLLDAETRGNSATGLVRLNRLTAQQVTTLETLLLDLTRVWMGWTAKSQQITTNVNQNSTQADRVRVLAGIALDVVNRVAQTTSNLLPTDPADTGAQEARKALALTGASSKLTADLVTEQYGAAVVDSKAFVGAIIGLDPPAPLKATLDEVQTVLPLISEIASAKSSADVSAALQAAAAPADSYRTKYQRPVVALDALVGGLVGYESPNKPSNQALGDTQGSGIAAGFAPVGVEATVPICSALYFGGMLSVLDLGALTTARFKSEVSTSQTVTSQTNVTVGQVFSPGVYALFGLGGSPLVVGGGASFAPSLRTLDTTNGGNAASENVSVVRVGGFLAMDLTILPL